jgi:hypothetical protein
MISNENFQLCCTVIIQKHVLSSVTYYDVYIEMTIVKIIVPFEVLLLFQFDLEVNINEYILFLSQIFD